MFSKLVATGEGGHPLYSALIEAQPKATPADEDMREKLKGYGITPTPEPEVLWNFEKFLVGRNGNIVARFAPNMAPDDPRIVSAIDAEMAKLPRGSASDGASGSEEERRVGQEGGEKGRTG